MIILAMLIQGRSSGADDTCGQEKNSEFASCEPAGCVGSEKWRTEFKLTLPMSNIQRETEGNSCPRALSLSTSLSHLFLTSLILPQAEAGSAYLYSLFEACFFSQDLTGIHMLSSLPLVYPHNHNLILSSLHLAFIPLETSSFSSPA